MPIQFYYLIYILALFTAAVRQAHNFYYFAMNSSSLFSHRNNVYYLYIQREYALVLSFLEIL